MTSYAETTETKNKLGLKIRNLFKNCNCATAQELEFSGNLLVLLFKNYADDYFKLLGIFFFWSLSFVLLFYRFLTLKNFNEMTKQKIFVCFLTCWIIDVKTNFEVKEERENDWMCLIFSFMHKFKGRLDWIFICYSIKNFTIKVFLFAWIPIEIRGYCYFSYFTHFYVIGCYAQNNNT